MKPTDQPGSAARLEVADSPSFGGTAGLGDTATSVNTLTSLNNQELGKYLSRASTAEENEDGVASPPSFNAGSQGRLWHGLEDEGKSATPPKFFGFQPHSSPPGQALSGKAALHAVVGSDDAPVFTKDIARSQTLTQFPGKSDDSMSKARMFHKSATIAFDSHVVPLHGFRSAMEKQPGKSIDATTWQTEIRRMPITAGREEDVGPIVNAAVPISLPAQQQYQQEQQQKGQQQQLQQQFVEQLQATELQRRAEMVAKLKEKDATINSLKLTVEELRLQRVNNFSDFTRRIDQLDKIITSSNITPDITVKGVPPESKEDFNIVPDEPSQAPPDSRMKPRSLIAAPAIQLPPKPSEQNPAYKSAFPRMENPSAYMPRLNGIFPVYRPPPLMCQKDYKNVPLGSCMDPERLQTYNTWGPLSLGAFSREFNLFKTETGEELYVDREKEHNRWQELESKHRQKVAASVREQQTGFPSMLASFFTSIS
eukprot:GEMP01038598.1.p1 GENE.GEMP01038598.1~~GEMP01038598.1.p1  ORF type:complete len:482 (+),score=119.07 GEMP01038598.1:100-1545(+)